jgi:hypothetical protein
VPEGIERQKWQGIACRSMLRRFVGWQGEALKKLEEKKTLG